MTERLKPVAGASGGLKILSRTFQPGERVPHRYRLAQKDLGLESRPVDPASLVPEAAPNYGRTAIPHIQTFFGVYTNLSRAYNYSDAALRDSVQQAHMMMSDPTITGPLFARTQMAALLDWSIECEEEDDPELKAVANEITRIIKWTPRFSEYCRNLMEAIWYGRAAVQQTWSQRQTYRDRKRYYHVDRWEPLNGDKLLFRYDDGSGDFNPGQIGVKVSHSLAKPDKLAGRRHLEPTFHGLAYFLQPWERPLIALHRHWVRDGDYEDPLSAGQIHGVGIRHFLYWIWFQKQETLRTLADIVERSSMGFTIYRYPSGNEEARQHAEELAETQQFNHAITMPVDPNDPDSIGVDQIPPNSQGIEILRTLLEEFFQNQITRFILGQTLSTTADATGMGSGVADLQKDSLYLVRRYDAENLQETITSDLVKPIVQYNFPAYSNAEFLFKFATDDPIPEERLRAIREAYDMGVSVRKADIYKAAKLTKPEATDDVVEGGGEQMGPMGLPMGPSGAEGPGGPQQQDQLGQMFGPVLYSRNGEKHRYWKFTGVDNTTGQGFDENKHPRGNSKNAGQFASKPGSPKPHQQPQQPQQHQQPQKPKPHHAPTGGEKPQAAPQRATVSAEHLERQPAGMNLKGFRRGSNGWTHKDGRQMSSEQLSEHFAQEPATEPGTPPQYGEAHWSRQVENAARGLGLDFDANSEDSTLQASRFLIKMAKRMGFEPQGNTLVHKASDAADYLDDKADVLDSVESMAEAFGYRSKSADRSTRLRGAVNHVMKLAEKSGYQPKEGAGLEERLAGSLEYLSDAVKDSPGGPPQPPKSLGGMFGGDGGGITWRHVAGFVAAYLIVGTLVGLSRNRRQLANGRMLTDLSNLIGGM